MNNKDGGPAFPVISERCGEYSGMSLRDYFAARAMQGQLACFREFETVIMSNTMEEKLKRMAEISYLMADAMLEASEK